MITARSQLLLKRNELTLTVVEILCPQLDLPMQLTGALKRRSGRLTLLSRLGSLGVSFSLTGLQGRLTLI